MALDPKTLKSIIGAHVAKAKKEHQQFDRWRAWYRSEFWGQSEAPDQDHDPLFIENNYLYAFADTMVASITPPTPRVTCIPRGRDEDMLKAAKYRESLINDILYRTDAHLLLWQMATHSSIYGRAILKSVWSFTRHRPDFVVIDPRHFFFDLSVSRWEDSRYAIEATTLTKAEFLARVKKPKKKNRSRSMQYDPKIAGKAKFGSYPKWLQDREQVSSSSMSKQVKEVFQWVTVYEVYDLTNDQYYHMLEDQEDPLFAGDLPYVFVRNPFILLTFNDNLVDIAGLSDSQLVERQQRRLNELDTLELRHAQASIPVTVLNEGLVDDPEDFADQVSTATSPGDVVRVKGKEAAPLGDIIGTTPTASMLPEFADIRDRIEASIQFVLGIPEYARGVAGTTEVATELALVDAAMRTRLGRRTKLLNRIIQHMARTTIGLYEEFLDWKTEIPVRVVGSRDVTAIARRHLTARNPRDAESAKNQGLAIEEPLDIDYEVVPYSPTENSKTAQLKKLTQFLEILMTSEHVNNRRLMEHLVDTLDLGSDVLLTEEEVESQQMQQAQMEQAMAQAEASAGGSDKGSGDFSGLTGPGPDRIGTGGMPEGAEEVPVGAIGAMTGGAGFPTPQG